MMAIMTVVYSVGRIIGPVLAGSLQAQSHSFSSALLAAASALLLAMIVSLRL
ncbi:YbfB/YjiJ family MFS transporter [Janthinobacterium sp. JC611]|uniref:YbfB/YjiJ family MFS transporter n=1 Tax=Janthinobacterium sp. JC611 TaxID=2816201 RepID=UPI00203E4E1E|nr:YbfB/YjiJ family MFS transporter [Janthinobacterium sp. JC611]